MMADLFGDQDKEDEEDQHILNLPKQLNICPFISAKNPLFSIKTWTKHEEMITSNHFFFINCGNYLLLYTLIHVPNFGQVWVSPTTAVKDSIP